MEELKASSPATRYYWLHSNQMSFDKNALYITTPPLSGKKLILPKALRDDALRMLHDDPSASHAGRDKTLARVMKKFHWFGIRNDIDLHVKTCHTCQQYKTAQRPPKHALVKTNTIFPFETVHIDYL